MPGDILSFQIGDVRDFHSVSSALKDMDIVFNAAALKQVPTCEYYPYQAVMTNVSGPENIVRAIEEQRLPIETVVGVSTDKACKPVNVMGITKAAPFRNECLFRRICAVQTLGLSAYVMAMCWLLAVRLFHCSTSRSEMGGL